MKPYDNSEAFDMAFALWYWFSHNYEGKSCPKYAAMCRMMSEYNLSNIPSIDFDDENDDEYFQARMYYQELTEENWEKNYYNWIEYMDNEWDKEAC